MRCTSTLPIPPPRPRRDRMPGSFRGHPLNRVAYGRGWWAGTP
ncbi:MAG: hypothetical protein NZ821_08250 [Gloeomargarita sp. SKYB31]|nr:hypothetical protein [Gloeomargarita sp. SKYB31]